MLDVWTACLGFEGGGRGKENRRGTNTAARGERVERERPCIRACMCMCLLDGS